MKKIFLMTAATLLSLQGAQAATSAARALEQFELGAMDRIALGAAEGTSDGLAVLELASADDVIPVESSDGGEGGDEAGGEGGDDDGDGVIIDEGSDDGTDGGEGGEGEGGEGEGGGDGGEGEGGGDGGEGGGED